MQRIISAITRSRSARTRNTNKIKLHELVVNHRLMSSKAAAKLTHCTKQQRNRVWNQQFGDTALFGDCMLCYAPNTVNCCYSDMLQLHCAQVFACTQCVNSSEEFPHALICLRTNTINDLRLRVWLYRNGLRRCAKCPCCDKKISLLESTWHVAHDIAVKHGGMKILHNLYTTCVDCNLAMSTNRLQDNLLTTVNDETKQDEGSDHQHHSSNNIQTAQTVDVCMRLLKN